MSQTTPPTPKPSWVSRALRVSLRILFVVVLGLAAGVGLYLGVTYLANRYFQSVQVNTQRIQALADDQALAESQTQQRFDDVIARLQSLETNRDSLKVTQADLQSRLAALETAQPVQSGPLETLTAVQGQVGALQAGQARLTTQIALATDLVRLSTASAAHAAALQTLDAQWAAAQTEIASARTDVQWLKAMELLTRARYNLYQNNLGLAQQDVQSAREVVLALHNQVSGDQATLLANVLVRLDGALEKLPNLPVAAGDELEGAWNLLATGSQDAIAAPDTTPTPAPLTTPTPTATPKP